MISTHNFRCGNTSKNPLNFVSTGTSQCFPFSFFVSEFTSSVTWVYFLSSVGAKMSASRSLARSAWVLISLAPLLATARALTYPALKEHSTDPPSACLTLQHCELSYHATVQTLAQHYVLHVLRVAGFALGGLVNHSTVGCRKCTVLEG